MGSKRWGQKMAEKDIYLSNQLVSVEKYDEETLKLTFKYGSEKLFKIESILNDESLHENYRNRFNLMYDAGAFFTAKSYNGDLVWPGWCEVFREDLEKYLVDLS